MPYVIGLGHSNCFLHVQRSSTKDRSNSGTIKDVGIPPGKVDNQVKAT